MTTILVCGGRRYTDRNAVFDALDRIHVERCISRVVQGGASGTDTLAAAWAHARGIDCITYKADWRRYGRAAGRIRNQTMLDVEKPNLVVAFPVGRGTADMLDRAERCGILVLQRPILSEPVS